MRYKIYQDENIDTLLCVNDDGSKTYIPFEPANSDYQQYLAWVAEGNTAEEWDNI